MNVIATFKANVRRCVFGDENLRLFGIILRSLGSLAILGVLFFASSIFLASFGLPFLIFITVFPFAIAAQTIMNTFVELSDPERILEKRKARLQPERSRDETDA
ncbi:MAG: hypothetical protein AAF511_09215 [Pseudomonadota bacterium]